jgi:putative Holliday junction resolvase
MRVLGVDFGGSRIGLAVGESEFGVTTARPPLSASGTLGKDAEAILQLARREQADKIAVGMPLDANGEPTKMSRICEKLAVELEKRGASVVRVNEAMSSQQAESLLGDEGLKAAETRRRVDGEAARIILERFFEESE